MRLDFAEERRWKRVLAREYAYQIVEWHLSTPSAKAEMMVGGIGWATRKYAPEPKVKERTPAAAQETAQEGAVHEDEVPDTSGEVLEEMMPRRAKRGRGRPKRYIDDEDDKMDDSEPKEKPEDPALDTEEVQMADDGPTAAAEGPTGAEPTDKPQTEMDTAVDPKLDSAGDLDAEGEADAEGELDAQGEDDGEGSADIVDGVIGLEGASCVVGNGCTRLTFRLRRCGWRR